MCTGFGTSLEVIMCAVRDVKRDTAAVSVPEDEGSWLLEMGEAGDDTH